VGEVYDKNEEQYQCRRDREGGEAYREEERDHPRAQDVDDLAVVVHCHALVEVVLIMLSYVNFVPNTTARRYANISIAINSSCVGLVCTSVSK